MSDRGHQHVLTSYVEAVLGRAVHFGGCIEALDRLTHDAELAVGLASKALVLQDAIENGYGCIDFLRGHEPYKYDLGGVDRNVYRCLVTRT